MITILSLTTLTNHYLTERGWWQFHNPKNDSIGIFVETSELAELFIKNNADKTDAAHEISDILNCIFSICIGNKIDVSRTICTITGSSKVTDASCTYDQLKEIVLKNLDKFNLNDLKNVDKIILSLVHIVGMLAELFSWCTIEDSVKLLENNRSEVANDISKIIAHLIFLADLLNIDLPAAFMKKMQKNFIKHPIGASSYEDIYKKIINKKRQSY